MESRRKILKDDPKITVNAAKEFAKQDKEAYCKRLEEVLLNDLVKQDYEANVALELALATKETCSKHQDSFVHLKKLALLKREDHVYRENAEKLFTASKEFGQKMISVTKLLSEAVRLHQSLSEILTLRAIIAAKIHWFIWAHSEHDDLRRQDIQQIHAFRFLKATFPELLEIAFT